MKTTKTKKTAKQTNNKQTETMIPVENLPRPMQGELRPPYNRALVRLVDGEHRTSGGLWLPSQDAEGIPRSGILIAKGKYLPVVGGSQVPLEADLGERIYFSKHCGFGFEITRSGTIEKYLMIQFGDIIAIESV